MPPKQRENGEHLRDESLLARFSHILRLWWGVGSGRAGPHLGAQPAPALLEWENGSGAAWQGLAQHPLLTGLVWHALGYLPQGVCLYPRPNWPQCSEERLCCLLQPDHHSEPGQTCDPWDPGHFLFVWVCQVQLRRPPFPGIPVGFCLV